MKQKSKKIAKKTMFWLGLISLGISLVAALVYFFPFLKNHSAVTWGAFNFIIKSVPFIVIPIVFVVGIILLIAQDNAFD
jgi:hypothetical protein